MISRALPSVLALIWCACFPDHAAAAPAATETTAPSAEAPAPSTETPAPAAEEPKA